MAAAQAMTRFNAGLAEQMQEMQKGGTFKTERVIVSEQSHVIRVQGKDKPLLNFCANNYLGLANNKELVAAAHEVGFVVLFLLLKHSLEVLMLRV